MIKLLVLVFMGRPGLGRLPWQSSSNFGFVMRRLLLMFMLLVWSLWGWILMYMSCSKKLLVLLGLILEVIGMRLGERPRFIRFCLEMISVYSSLMICGMSFAMKMLGFLGNAS